MLSTLLKPFTTPTAAGTVFRDLFLAAGAVITILGILGILTPEQVASLRAAIEQISGQWPAIVAAVGVLMAAGMSLYRAVFKSQTKQEAEVIAAIREELPPQATVEIKTPGSAPNIVVPPK